MNMTDGKSNNDYNKNLKKYARKLRKNSTLPEVILWSSVLKRKQLKGYQFLRQRPIGNYIVDFFCKELKLIIEIDGEIHQFQKSKDARREEDLKELGYINKVSKQGNSGQSLQCSKVAGIFS